MIITKTTDVHMAVLLARLSTLQSWKCRDLNQERSLVEQLKQAVTAPQSTARKVGKSA